MPRRRILLREIFMFALVIGIGLVVLVVGILQLGGLLSGVWFARALFICAVIALVVEWFIVRQARRISIVRGPLESCGVNDRTQGCSVAMLGALVTIGLLICSILMEWWVEFK